MSTQLKTLFAWILLGIIACGEKGNDPSQAPQPESMDVRKLPAVAIADVETVNRLALISVDGLRRDAVTADQMPFLFEAQHKAMMVKEALTIVPSITLPSHTSMLTGTDISTHGVDWNSYIPERGQVQVTVLTRILTNAGVVSGAFFSKAKLYHIFGRDHTSMVDEARTAGDASELVDHAIAFFRESGKRFAFIHFREVDAVGHGSGWKSAQQLAAIHSIDQQVARLVRDLQSTPGWATTVVVVTSDHGGHGYGHGSASLEDRRIPWLAFGPPISGQQIIEDTLITYDTAPTVLQFFGIPRSAFDFMDGKAIFQRP